VPSVVLVPAPNPAAWHRRAAAALAVAVALLLAGCGGGDKPNVASISSPNTSSSKAPTPGGGSQAGGDYQDKLRKWTRCMRDNGFSIPDPTGNSDGVPGVDPNDPKFESASKACKALEPPAPEDLNDPVQQDKVRKYAACMRQHGVDMKDPKPGEGLALPNGGDPKVDTAVKACSSLLG